MLTRERGTRRNHHRIPTKLLHVHSPESTREEHDTCPDARGRPSHEIRTQAFLVRALPPPPKVAAAPSPARADPNRQQDPTWVSHPGRVLLSLFCAALAVPAAAVTGSGDREQAQRVSQGSDVGGVVRDSSRQRV
jgi:hypothetical protein